MRVGPNIILPPHHEVHFPPARQLDHSIMPMPVLFHIDDTEMASFTMPHMAEQPMSASSMVDMEMGPVLDIAPLDPQVMMAIKDPSEVQTGAGISVCMSDIVQHYVKEKQASAISAPIPAPIPAPTPGPSAVSGVRLAQDDHNSGKAERTGCICIMFEGCKACCCQCICCSSSASNTTSCTCFIWCAASSCCVCCSLHNAILPLE